MNNFINYELDCVEDVSSLPDWKLPRVFASLRHTTKIETMPCIQHSWRMKERMKTVSVALVLCLNVGVDPPDILKTQPCAKYECWIDPLSMAPQKALEAIGNNLMKQYERWQPRARYKQSLDPTVEEVKKLCSSLRRNAKDERVLFHYNGHGVPKPTKSGEIWVFNRSYTQYIPLSLYDLQQWMGSPSIYVYDCSCAGLIVQSFEQFALRHEREYETLMNNLRSQNSHHYRNIPPSPPCYKNCIQLAACAADQILPMNPDLPADLFTSCLTTPIKTALRWFIMQNSSKLLPDITVDLIEKIPGQLSDRRTMLGELNWIFTAITDTIAWNVLPRDVFQRLFRQDLLVASLFRNFLLADRIMRSYNCTPVSSPKLPPTYHHPMWQAWDLAVDDCLHQLPSILEDDKIQYRHSKFFSEQLTAFEVWLTFGAASESAINLEENNPEQLPIVLQVLLSHAHRLRALELLGKFLDLGPIAVHLALSVGIFPYVLKLLQSSANDLRHLLVFIWTKILAVDGSCQTELVRERGHKYFLNVLYDTSVESQCRTMAAFIIACIVRNHHPGQEAAFQGGLIAVCLEQIGDVNPHLRQWLTICLGLTWNNYDSARWCGVRDSAHEKLFTLLNDDFPEVRAAAVYALGTFITGAVERTDHANTIDHSIGITLINTVFNDGSPLVRKELVVALQWLILLFKHQFISVAYQTMEEEKCEDALQLNNPIIQGDGSFPGSTPPSNNPMVITHGLRKVASKDRLMKLFSNPSPSTNTHLSAGTTGCDALTPPNNTTNNLCNSAMKRISSTNSLGTFGNSSFGSSTGIGNVYSTIWRAILALCNDSHPDVAHMAQMIVNEIKSRVSIQAASDPLKESRSDPSFSEPSSPAQSGFVLGDSPPPTFSTGGRERPLSESSGTNYRIHCAPILTPYSRKRKIFGKEPNFKIFEDSTLDDNGTNYFKTPLVNTEFIGWCIRNYNEYFVRYKECSDPESPAHYEREWRTVRNYYMRLSCKEELRKTDPTKLDEQLFVQKNSWVPSLIKFHPYEPHLIVAEKESFSVWLWDSSGGISYSNGIVAPSLLGTFSNLNPSSNRITSLQLVNPHDITILMLACDDGSVRAWRIHSLQQNSSQPELVTSFHIFNDMPSFSKAVGTVIEWNQSSAELYASGDSKVIRIWDSQTELRLRDIPTGADCSVTSLSTDGQNLICAGCQFGCVRIYDKRVADSDCKVLAFKEHCDWIVNACIYPEGEKHFDVLSGSQAGDVKFWDKRQSKSIKTITVSPHRISAMSVHREADLFACATTNQSIHVYTLDGIPGSVIRYHDSGFMSQRISPITCLDFHPFKVNLAVGCKDSVISVYSSPKNY